jgi:hypothetical protein
MTEEIKQDELTVLKARADRMGMSYHPSIGLDKLKEKITEALSKQKPQTVQEVNVVSAEETENQRKVRKKREATKLVRVRITCMNPNKREWPSEVFTVSNSVVPKQERCVPFGVEWHVPQIMLNMIQQRQCQVFYSVRDKWGNNFRQGKLIKEFAVEILPDLTREEIKDLAQRQAMASGTSEAA